MTAEILAIVASFLAGALLGLVFFWSLWATVEGLGHSQRPAARVLVSVFLRFGLTLLVFYLFARYGDWPQLLAAALGFVTARPFVVRTITRRGGRGESRP